MRYALNKDGLKIDAYDADKEEQYACPICGNRVILKRGSINIDHFAHESNVCEDNWNYDMSEWHKRMQNYFPKESQEVVVGYKGKKHRADVLIGDMVLEFQYSPITAAEFEDRNEFFKNAGYRLAWVFNLSQISEDNLYPSDEKENRDGHHFVISPLATVFANGNYYVLSYYPKYGTISHYRVDRMERVDIIEDDAEFPPKEMHFDVANYKKQLFGMFSGETTSVTIELHKSLIDVVFDLFGDDTKITACGEEKIRITVDVQVSDLFFGWCSSFGEKVKLCSPETVRCEYNEYLELLLREIV